MCLLKGIGHLWICHCQRSVQEVQNIFLFASFPCRASTCSIIRWSQCETYTFFFKPQKFDIFWMVASLYQESLNWVCVLLTKTARLQPDLVAFESTGHFLSQQNKDVDVGALKENTPVSVCMCFWRGQVYNHFLRQACVRLCVSLLCMIQ